MDAIEKASESTKAVVLVANAALLEIACRKASDHETLKTIIMQIVSDNRALAAEIRAKVDAEDFRRN